MAGDRANGLRHDGRGSDRDREIVERRRAGETLEAIGDRFGISSERVRQIVRRADGTPVAGQRPQRRRGRAVGGERVRLRIGNLAKAVLVTGQAYQDPKDALNEFVSNAADTYAESERRGERIRVVLRRKGRHPVIAVDDNGSGMSPDRLREVARNLFESEKSGDDRTLGEKAIGLLGFQQLGARCEVVSRSDLSTETWTLTLDRGGADATLTRERRRARTGPGTTVYLSQLDPEVLRMLTQRKVVDYLRRRRGPALARGDYSLEVVEGRNAEVVTPEKPEGVKLSISPQSTLWGRIEFGLYVAHDVDPKRRVAVVGRAGIVIVDDLAELEEFAEPPWTSGQISGQVSFDALQQTAGRRAILRDRDAFPVFRDALDAVEPLVLRTVERVRQEIDEQTADRVSEAVRRLFGRVLKELADLDNPMRSPLGETPGEGGLLVAGTNGGADLGPSASTERADETPHPSPPIPAIDELTPAQVDRRTTSAAPQANRFSRLPTVAVDPDPRSARSRFDPEAGVVFYNDGHPDYLTAKDNEVTLVDYLTTLVAKEYVVYNNPLANAEDVGEEMVRMLVSIRRHLPRQR